MVERVNSSTDELHIHLTPTVRPNWEKLADLVGFDEWDRLALRYRLAGASRDRAMAEQPDETSRKAFRRLGGSSTVAASGACRKRMVAGSRLPSGWPITRPHGQRVSTIRGAKTFPSMMLSESEYNQQPKSTTGSPPRPTC